MNMHGEDVLHVYSQLGPVQIITVQKSENQEPGKMLCICHATSGLKQEWTGKTDHLSNF